MTEANLFTRLSAYRPGSPATPFETYCTGALAHMLETGTRSLGKLLANAAGASTGDIAQVEVQSRVGDAGIADMLVTFEDGHQALVEVQVEPGADESLLPAFAEAAESWDAATGLVIIGLHDKGTPEGWFPLQWLDVAAAVEDDDDPLVRQFAEFVRRDILGLGDVGLDIAIETNRLYALGGGAVQRAFGPPARWVNGTSRPVGGQYRYLGTIFAPDGGDMDFWIGIVNETVPLGEHYHLMLASKTTPLAEPADQPRATGDWNWPYWTGLGRVVRPVGMDDYAELLSRIPR